MNTNCVLFMFLSDRHIFFFFWQWLGAFNINMVWRKYIRQPKYQHRKYFCVSRVLCYQRKSVSNVTSETIRTIAWRKQHKAKQKQLSWNNNTTAATIDIQNSYVDACLCVRERRVRRRKHTNSHSNNFKPNKQNKTKSYAITTTSVKIRRD